MPVQQNQQEEAQEGTPQEEPRKPIRLNAVVRRKIREMESQYDNMVNEGKTSPEALKQIRENIDHWIQNAYSEAAQGRSFVDASEAQIAFEESIVENPETGERGLVDSKSGKFMPFSQDKPRRTVEEIVKQDTYKDEEGNLWALDASRSPKIIKQATVKSEPSRPGYLTEEEIYARQKKRLEQVRNMTVTETDEDGVETERPATPEEMVAELNRLNEVDLALDTAAKRLSTYSYSGDGIAPGDPFYEPEEEKKPKRGKKRPPGISVKVTPEEANNPLIRDYMEEVNAAEESWDRARYNPIEATIADRNIYGFSSSWISDTSNMKDATREMKNDAIKRRKARVGIYGWILDEIKAEKERLDKKEQKEGKLALGDNIEISKMRLLRDMLQPGNPLFKVDGTIEHKFVEQMKNDDKSEARKFFIDKAVKSIESLMAEIMHGDTGAT